MVSFSTSYAGVLFATILLAALVDTAESCGGVKLKIKSISNCPGTDNVIRLDNVGAEVTDKCIVKPHGCFETDGIKNGKVTYKITKNGNVMLEGTDTMCKQIGEGSKEAQILDIIGMPHECPADKFKLCFDDKKIDINKYKAYLGLARGKIEVDVDIKHDNGNTCIKAKAEISK